MPLVFMRAVPQLAQPVEEHGPGQSFFGFAFIKPDVDAPPKFDTC